MSREDSTKRNIFIALVALIVIVAAMLALSLTSPSQQPQPGGGGGGGQQTQEVAHVVVDDAGFVGGEGSTLIRVTVRNDGTVAVRIKEIVVKGEGLEGSQIQTKTLPPGQTAQLDVGLKKGAAKSGSNPVTFIIKTDKGDFEQKYTITVS
ncbi:hypothetical protein J7K07_07490 [Candidatus Bathyarchaeota archaeon]|nr:hypothetical protein [Candidatus Bathyarchaeota archaeon]